jgi:hypothetical protein
VPVAQLCLAVEELLDAALQIRGHGLAPCA